MHVHVNVRIVKNQKFLPVCVCTSHLGQGSVKHNNNGTPLTLNRIDEISFNVNFIYFSEYDKQASAQTCQLLFQPTPHPTRIMVSVHVDQVSRLYLCFLYFPSAFYWTPLSTFTYHIMDWSLMLASLLFHQNLTRLSVSKKSKASNRSQGI